MIKTMVKMIRTIQMTKKNDNNNTSGNDKDSVVEDVEDAGKDVIDGAGAVDGAGDAVKRCRGCCGGRR